MLESSDEEDVEKETLSANKKSPTPTEKKNLGNNRKYVLLHHIPIQEPNLSLLFYF